MLKFGKKNFKRVIRRGRKQILKTFFILFLVASWLLTGWPAIWPIGRLGINTIRFPPEVQKAKAAPIAQYSGGLLVYADTATVGTPKYRVFDDTTGFGAEQSASSVGSNAIVWLRVAASPVNDEWIIATKDSAGVIKAQVCTGVDGGVSCGTPTTITSSGNTSAFRNFDVAYEYSSGDALLVYGTATADELRKIEWNGSSWVNDAAITTTRTSGTVEWVELTSRGGSSDQIGIAYSDTNDDVSAYRWNGTSVADEATAAITTSATTGDCRKFDISFEGTSGDMYVSAPLASAGTNAEGRLEGTTWTITTRIAPDQITGCIDLQEPNPSDDDIAMIAHGITSANANTAEGYEWSGTGFTDGSVAEDTAITNWAASYQLAAVAYVSTTYYAVGVYSDANDDINWWTMNSGGTWTAQTDNLRTRGTIRFVDLFDYPNANKVLLLSTDANSDLWADTWDGSTPSSTVWVDLTSGGALETDLASATTDVVDFAFRLAPITPSTNQSAFRWRNDDGSESGATWKAAENTAITNVSTSEIIRLRTEIEETNYGTATVNARLEFSSDATSCTNGTWTALDTSSTAWRITDSTNITNGGSTTNQLTTSSRTFTAGRIFDTQNEDATGVSLNNSHTEWEWAIRGDGAAGSTTYYFRVTDSGTVLDNYANCAQLTTSAAQPTFTQNDFEWFVDENSVSLTDAWPTGPLDLSENEVFTQLPAAKRPLVSGDRIRIQINITVGTANLSSGSQAFQLEYVAASDCTTASGWATVGAIGSATIWRFFDNTTLTDGTTQVNQISTSTTGAEGRYLESNSSSWTNPNAVNVGQSMEWDFAVENNGASENTTYCFRVTKYGGTALDTYNSDSYPKLTTAPGISNLMRHGNFFQGEAEKGFFWVD